MPTENLPNSTDVLQKETLMQTIDQIKRIYKERKLTSRIYKVHFDLNCNTPALHRQTSESNLNPFSTLKNPTVLSYNL